MSNTAFLILGMVIGGACGLAAGLGTHTQRAQWLLRKAAFLLLRAWLSRRVLYRVSGKQWREEEAEGLGFLSAPCSNCAHWSRGAEKIHATMDHIYWTRSGARLDAAGNARQVPDRWMSCTGSL